MSQPQPGPRELVLYATSRCNAKCTFCSRQTVGAPTAPDIEPDLLEHVLNRYPSIEAVCIAGFGESLLWRHLYPCLKILERRGIFVGLITNGVVLREHINRLADAHLGYLSLSVNAANAYERRERMGLSDWPQVVGLLHEAKIRGIPTQASFVIGTGNWQRIDAYCDIIEETGVIGVFVNTLPHGGDPAAILRLPEHALAAAYIDHVRKTHPARIQVAVWPTFVDDNPPWNCQSHGTSLGIDGAGNVSFCRRVLGPRPEFGNILDDDNDPWTNAHVHALRLSAAQRKPEWLPEPCTECFGCWKG